MARFGMGSILAATTAGAYGMNQVKDQGLGGFWSMLPGNWGSSSSSGGSSEVSALQAELRRLTGMMGDIARSNNNRPTVVQVGSGRSAWTVLIVPTAVGGVALYLYCRVTGSSIWDILYVSRSSLTSFKKSVQESMSTLWEEMKKQKEEVLKVVGNLGRKQDELKESQDQLMAKQQAMDDTLNKVNETCYQLDDKASHTIQHVEKLDTRLQDVHSGVTAANQGIFMLVSAVSEVTQRIGLNNSRAAKALKAYAEGGPAWYSGGAAPPAVTSGPALTALPAPINGTATAPAAAAVSNGSGVQPGTASVGLRGFMSGISLSSAERATSAHDASKVGLAPFSLTEEPVEASHASSNGVSEPVAVAMPVKKSDGGLRTLGFM